MIEASLTLLGDKPIGIQAASVNGGGSNSGAKAEETGSLPGKASLWMKQNGLSMAQIEQVFHFDGDTVDVIASEIPGKNAKQKTLNAYVLIGISKLLATGSASFDDESARTLCKSSGCYNKANHALYLSDRGNIFTGSKDKGWTLTAPGLKQAAEMVKGFSSQDK